MAVVNDRECIPHINGKMKPRKQWTIEEKFLRKFYQMRIEKESAEDNLDYFADLRIHEGDVFNVDCTHYCPMTFSASEIDDLDGIKTQRARLKAQREAQ